MKIKLLLASVILGLVSPVFGGAIASSNIVDLAGNDVIVTFDGSALTSGYASSGYFSIPDADVLAGSSDATSLMTLFSSYTSLGTDDFSSLGTAGFYNIGADYTASSANLGRTLYTVIGNGADLASSTAFLLFQHNETIDADTPLPDSNTINLADGTLLFGEMGGEVTVDGTNLTGGPITGSSVVLVGEVIPEPSVALLGALGALGLLRRRR